MSVEVLEIGYGSHPAFKEGGLFDDPDVHYIGLELPASFDGSFVPQGQPRDFTNLTGSMDAMPFKDGAFDYVLMRSVFGQFKSQPAIVPAVRMGKYECMRVLKPGGQIVVSEENTPRDLEYIRSELTAAGFAIKAACYMSNKKWDETPEYDEYRVLRSAFYCSKPAGAYGSYMGTPNIVIGSKPEDIEFREMAIDVMTNFYEDRISMDEWKIRKLTFKVPIRDV